MKKHKVCYTRIRVINIIEQLTNVNVTSIAIICHLLLLFDFFTQVQSITHNRDIKQIRKFSYNLKFQSVDKNIYWRYRNANIHREKRIKNYKDINKPKLWPLTFISVAAFSYRETTRHKKFFGLTFLHTPVVHWATLDVRVSPSPGQYRMGQGMGSLHIW